MITILRLILLSLLVFLTSQAWGSISTTASTYNYDVDVDFSISQSLESDTQKSTYDDRIIHLEPVGSSTAYYQDTKPQSEVFLAFADSFIVTKGPLKNASGNLDDAARAARTQPHNTPNLTEHARAQTNTRGVSVDQAVDAANRGSVTSKVGDPVVKRLSTSSGRKIEVRQDVRTNNVVTVIDKGSEK